MSRSGGRVSRGGAGGILYRANSANLPSNTERRPAKTELALRNKKDSLFLNYNGRQVFEERKMQKVQQTVSVHKNVSSDTFILHKY